MTEGESEVDEIVGSGEDEGGTDSIASWKTSSASVEVLDVRTVGASVEEMRFTLGPELDDDDESFVGSDDGRT